MWRTVQSTLEHDVSVFNPSEEPEFSLIFTICVEISIMHDMCSQQLFNLCICHLNTVNKWLDFESL